ncbi:hypothetical protein [Mucilaginibacter glaciei]|uniref:Uncharacterized protein n=1 Tax=Mucilaginibacter glaciei TaxID=2772109 RepID=A0A926NH79_9SPHI|nr:hypothetical protein [Mucilaginibacter glaciei]MBD1392024.1 hypothetical protein [Mucilaginibacter glaciei]
MKILITSATAAEAHKLKGKLINNEVLLGDHADLPAFMRSNIIKLPNPATDTYAHEMLTLSLDMEIEALYLLQGQELEILLRSEVLFNEYHINIIDGRNYL